MTSRVPSGQQDLHRSGVLPTLDLRGIRERKGYYFYVRKINYESVFGVALKRHGRLKQAGYTPAVSTLLAK